MTTPFACSFGRNHEDNHPATHSAATFADLQDAILLARHTRPREQSPYVSRPFAANGEGRPHRTIPMAIPVGWIALDVDLLRPDAVDALNAILSRWEGFWHSTGRATPENRKRRVFLSLSRVAALDEHERIVTALERLIVGRLGAAIEFDHGADIDLARLWYLPHVQAESGAFLGDPVDVDGALAYQADAAPPQPAAVPFESDSLTEGGRNVALTRRAGRMRRAGMGEDEILDALHAVNARRCQPPLDGREIRTIARSAMRWPSGERGDAETAGLRLIWARDFDPMLNVEYAVDGLIGLQEVIALYGPPKCGKTFVGTHLAGCVATGMAFFGLPTTKGVVIYVASEMGLRAQRRGYAWMRHNLGELEDHDLPFAIVPHPVNLMDGVAVDKLKVRLREVIAERGPVTMLIIDTLARSMVGGDENSAKDIGIAIGVATELRDEFHCAVVIIHHTGKDAAKGMRGSSALLGAVDLSLYVERDDSGHRITAVDARDIPEGATFGFKLPVLALGATPRGVAITSCVVEPCDTPPASETRISRTREPAGAVQRIVWRCVREIVAAHGEPVPQTSTIPPGTQWVAAEMVFFRAIPMLPGEPEPRRARASVKRALNSLIADGFLGFQAEHVWVNR